jgi:hypothetical protein
LKKQINNELLSAVRKNTLAPEDLILLDPQELIDVIQYLCHRHTDAVRPAPPDIRNEWLMLFLRFRNSRKNNEDRTHRLKILFGDDSTSETFHLISEILEHYFSELDVILRTFGETGQSLEAVTTIIKDVTDRLRSDEVGVIEVILRLLTFRLLEVTQLHEGLIELETIQQTNGQTVH